MMARSGRGGRRQGTKGQAYGQRTDLTQAPSAAPGQTYGMATQQLQAQAQAPLPKQASPPAPVGSAPAGPIAPAGAAPVAPGGLGPLHAPSQRPGEPITAGLTSGPGAGPEAITAPDPLLNAAAILNNLGDHADPQTALLRARVNAALANQGAA